MAVAINPSLSLVPPDRPALPRRGPRLRHLEGLPPFSRRSQTALDKVNSVMRENLAGVRVIKAFVRSDYEVERFGDANGKLADITVKASRGRRPRHAPHVPHHEPRRGRRALAVPASQVDSGRMEVGKVIAFTTYLTQIPLQPDDGLLPPHGLLARGGLGGEDQGSNGPPRGIGLRERRGPRPRATRRREVLPRSRATGRGIRGRILPLPPRGPTRPSSRA